MIVTLNVVFTVMIHNINYFGNYKQKLDCKYKENVLYLKNNITILSVDVE